MINVIADTPGKLYGFCNWKEVENKLPSSVTLMANWYNDAPEYLKDYRIDLVIFWSNDGTLELGGIPIYHTVVRFPTSPQSLELIFNSKIKNKASDAVEVALYSLITHSKQEKERKERIAKQSSAMINAINNAHLELDNFNSEAMKTWPELFGRVA